MTASQEKELVLSQERSRLLTLLLEQEGLDIKRIIPVSTEEQKYPLSFTQQRIWFISQLTPGNIAYNVPAAFRIKGSLHIETFTRSFQELLRRHTILRTTFAYEQEQIIQIVSPFTLQILYALPLIDLTSLPSPVREETAYRLARAEAQRPFLLSEDWPIRVQLLRLDMHTHVLLLMLHHIAVDEWSSGLLRYELDALYTAFSQGHPSPLPELALQYGDYAKQQQAQADSEELQQQLTYWRTQLADIPTLELPTDFPHPLVETFQGTTYKFLFTGPLLVQLKLFSQREGVTLFMTLLAAFQILLMRYTGQEDIVVGTPIAVRTSVELEKLIGCVVNTLVLRTNLAGNPSFYQLLQRVHEVALGAYAHQDVPFERLVEVLRPKRNLGRNPLHQVLFQLLNEPRELHSLGDLKIAPMALHMITTKFDLSLDLIESTQGLAGHLTYSTDLFTERSIHILVEQFRYLLERIIEKPAQHIWQLPLQSTEQLTGNEPFCIFDPYNQPVPSGLPGELMISGISYVAPYMGGDTALLHPHPIRKQANAYLYHTGIRARYLHDGTLQFLSNTSPTQTIMKRVEISSGDEQTVLPIQDSVKTTTKIEQTIVSIWQELLRHQEVGLNDNFFDLGGHSLQLIRMQSQLKEKLQQDIPVMEIFKYPTISLLARYFNGQTTVDDKHLPAKNQARATARRTSVQRRIVQQQTNNEQGG